MEYIITAIVVIFGTIVGNAISLHLLRKDSIEDIKQKTKEVIYNKPRGHIFEKPRDKDKDLEELLSNL